MSICKAVVVVVSVSFVGPKDFLLLHIDLARGRISSFKFTAIFTRHVLSVVKERKDNIFGIMSLGSSLCINAVS